MAAASDIQPGAAETSKELITSAFKNFDTNGDGVITLEELTHVLTVLNPEVFDRDAVKAMMDAMDRDNDGKVGFPDFVAWVMGETFAPLDRRGSFDMDYRVFLPEHDTSSGRLEDRYNLGNHSIGEGGFGKVFIAEDKRFANIRVAVKKVLRTESANASATLDREIAIMKQLDHPNICKLLATYGTGREMYFVMELCEGGELFDRIIESKFMSETTSAAIVAQCAAGLAYAHGQNIVHRDIKPENVVFCSKDRDDLSVKLIDWGMALNFVSSELKSAVGSFTYAAPEVIEAQSRGKSYTKACDLWSLGILTYVMLCGKPPFWGNRQQFIRKQKKEEFPLKDAPWTNISSNAKEFVTALLKCKPDARMDAESMLKHHWLLAEKPPVDEAVAKEVYENLKHFSRTTTFTRLCIAAVARQLDHHHLQNIHQVFRDLDTNGDGVLSKQEISDGFNKLCGKNSKFDLDELFENLDLDASAFIDYTEFCAAGLGQKAATQDEVLWLAFKAFDADSTGQISVKRLQDILDKADVKDEWTADVCAEVAKEIIDKYDKDDDDAIGFEDWKHLMKQSWERHLTLDDLNIDSKAAQEQDMPSSTTRPALRTANSMGGMGTYELLTQVSKLPAPCDA